MFAMIDHDGGNVICNMLAQFQSTPVPVFVVGRIVLTLSNAFHLPDRGTRYLDS